jgi:hypothetical protein
MIIDEIASEKPASVSASRSVRAKHMPEVRQIIERKATDNISLYRG